MRVCEKFTSHLASGLKSVGSGSLYLIQGSVHLPHEIYVQATRFINRTLHDTWHLAHFRTIASFGKGSRLQAALPRIVRLRQNTLPSYFESHQLRPMTFELVQQNQEATTARERLLAFLRCRLEGQHAGNFRSNIDHHHKLREGWGLF